MNNHIPLVKLQPLLYQDIGNSGTAVMTFICPACNNNGIISVRVGPQFDPVASVWQVAPMPDGKSWDDLTIQPSIDNTQSGHGSHRPPCTFHGVITKGVVYY